MTQLELAQALGLKNRTSITKIEQNAYEVSLEKLKKIARVLGVDPDYLIFGDAEDKKAEIEMIYDQLTPDQRNAVLSFLRTMIGARLKEE